MNIKTHLTHTLREHSRQLGLKEAKAFEESHGTDASGINSVSRDPGACESSQCINKRPKDDFTNYNNVKLHWDFYLFVPISLED